MILGASCHRCTHCAYCVCDVTGIQHVYIYRSNQCPLNEKRLWKDAFYTYIPEERSLVEDSMGLLKSINSNI